MSQDARFRVRALLDSYASDSTTPRQVVETVIARTEASRRPEVWLSRVSAADLASRAAALEAARAQLGAAVFERMPLFGVPFAVKDNIDVAGIPTTAACEAFAYTPRTSAFVVDRLLDAGAILIGKTNLDQFATGLVGTRSPYGAVRQIESDAHISGGSSSGSAVAVAAGLVAFALGTDTAGSGRVPAGFNELVGLKPTPGLVSKRGVVPACRSLDCVSIFAHDVGDAWEVLLQMAKYDDQDDYARRVPSFGLAHTVPRLGVPEPLTFFGDAHAQQAFAATLDAIATRLALTPAYVPFEPMQRTAALLYDGPWVAERRAALGTFFDTHRAAIDPVVAEVIANADSFSAADAFKGQYTLVALRREVEALFEAIDVLIVPTAPTHPTFDEVRADPIRTNSQLGLYTNFVNLLDLCALAVPGVRRADGLPAGVTLIAPAGADQRLAVLGAQIQALFTTRVAADAAAIAARPLPFEEPTVTLAVAGAHLRGQPLCWQLLEAGARFVATTTTSAQYRLYALAGTSPAKPALVRSPHEAGQPIEIELWEVPLRSFGAFVARVPAPLGIGSVQTADGLTVKGFICEPSAVSPGSGARDITEFGGWRAWLASATGAQA
ncbi:allophanate hydrolase [Paraburkholderia sp. MMS20-SJTN17]|uniref:Allophanate hydrolase n=1 Tax=Paraburkholderia translucens TaxID=2886945 RepID=A0ABS8KD48_9BURK|nr:allophanate hydrolase [Paraburkholderia sp. MMS20-SJTN17]MCC8402693.1 allophanate hydrolase [Paraburkholderia sp. MMS20-SJTN17]